VKHLLDVLAGISFIWFLEDHPQKLSEIDVTTLIFIIGGHSFIYVASFGMIAFVFCHGFQQITRGQSAIMICVKFIEDNFPKLGLALADEVVDVLSRLEMLVVVAGC